MSVVCNTTVTTVFDYGAMPWSHLFVFVFRWAVLSTGILLNAWIIFVSLSPKITGCFKYPLCNLAVWDVLYCVLMGTDMNRQAVYIDFLNHHLWLCRLLYLLRMTITAGMMSALVGCPTQRLMIFYNGLPMAEHAVKPKPSILFGVAIAGVYAVPTVIALYGPKVDCIPTFCGQLSGIKPLLNVTYSLVFVGCVVAFIEVLLVVRKLREMSRDAVEDQQTLKEHRDITRAFLIQTFNPILLGFISLFYVAFFGIKSRMESSMWQKLILSSIQLNPMVDALATIYTIKDYRRLAKQIIIRHTQSVSKVEVIPK